MSLSTQTKFPLEKWALKEPRLASFYRTLVKSNRLRPIPPVGAEEYTLQIPDIGFPPTGAGYLAPYWERGAELPMSADSRDTKLFWQGYWKKNHMEASYLLANIAPIEIFLVTYQQEADGVITLDGVVTEFPREWFQNSLYFGTPTQRTFQANPPTAEMKERVAK